MTPITRRIRGENYCGVHCRRRSASSSFQNGKGKPRTQLTEKANKRAVTACNHSVTFPGGKEKIFKTFPKLNLMFAFQIQRELDTWVGFHPEASFTREKAGPHSLAESFWSCCWITQPVSFKELVSCAAPLALPWFCCVLLHTVRRCTRLLLTTGVSSLSPRAVSSTCCSVPAPAASNLPKNLCAVTAIIFVENSF